MKAQHIQFIHFFIKKQNRHQLEGSLKILKKIIQKKLFQIIKLEILK